MKAGESCLFWCLLDQNYSGDSHHSCDDGRDPEKPFPMQLRYSPQREAEARKESWGKFINGKLPELYHETKNSGEGSALGTGKPGRIDLDHPRGSKCLHVAIENPDQGESREAPDSRNRPK